MADAVGFAPFAARWPLRTFLELGALPGAVPCARLHARNVLREWGLTVFSESTGLLVSELVTNAIQISRVAEQDAPVRLWLVSDWTHRRPVPADCVPAFGTEHIDLNWQNITAPHFCILDMEHWCSAVSGYGAAYLYLTALEVPPVADRVHAVLADVLDTPCGRYAQLVAAALILRNLTRLPDPGRLAARLHAYTDTLLA